MGSVSRAGRAGAAVDEEGSPVPRLHAAGSGALLFDVAHGAFDAQLQARLWSLGERLGGAGAPAGILEVVPGVNNLLLDFDPLVLAPAAARAALLQHWRAARVRRRAAREIDVPVVYGGAAGEDLAPMAARAGLDVAAFVKAHSEAVYSVAAIGAYPGFVYLSGLPPALAAPRRNVPRARLPAGAVIIGGVQGGIMPCDGPSGWHVLGLTDLVLFDAQRDPPCLFLPGDRLRFRAVRIDA